MSEPSGNGGGDLLEVDHVQVLFPIRSGALVARVVGHVHAVDDVSFVLHEGETLGIVGESGCGKSTLIRTLMRLVDSTGGAIRYRGKDITSAGRRELGRSGASSRWSSRIRSPRSTRASAWGRSSARR